MLETSPACYNVNTEENAYSLSLEITAAGNAETSLTAEKSAYSAAIENPAQLGMAVELSYQDGLAFESCVLKFGIKNEYIANELDFYTAYTDELSGIKRLQIFRFDEENSILTPVYTDFDVENNIVFCRAEELGTYCLLDVEVFLNELGYVPEEPAVALMSLSAEEDFSTYESAMTKYTCGDSEYGVYKSGYSISWSRAKEICEGLGGNLATITTQEEQDKLEEAITNKLGNSYWLGGTEDDSGSWGWITGELFEYTNWGAGQPDSGYGNAERYLGVLTRTYAWGTFGQWNDFTMSASDVTGFVCEWNDRTETEYRLLIGNSMKQAVLNDELSPYSPADTDEDGLTDWDEVDETSHLISFDEAGNPQFSVWVNATSTSGYFLRPNKFEDYLNGLYDFMSTFIVVPCESDPTEDDSDQDNAVDIHDALPLAPCNNSNILPELSQQRIDILDEAYEYYSNNYIFDYNNSLYYTEDVLTTREYVIILQKCLEFLGYLSMDGASYGRMGGLTRSATMLYQLNHNLFVNNSERGIDEATFYSILLSASYYGFNEIDKEMIDTANEYFHSLYIPKTFPMTEEGIVSVSTYDSGTVENIYYYDYTEPLNKVLLHGAKEFHQHYYICKSIPSDELWLCIRPKKNWVDYKWLIQRVKNGAKYDIKLQNPWEELMQILLTKEAKYYHSAMPFIFNGKLINAEQFGNILYGFICNAGGFNLSELIFGGSLYSFVTTLQFDNPEDREMIELGYNMFNSYENIYSYIHETG